jgi:hypothetical protein
MEALSTTTGSCGPDNSQAHQRDTSDFTDLPDSLCEWEKGMFEDGIS